MVRNRLFLVWPRPPSASRLSGATRSDFLIEDQDLSAGGLHRRPFLPGLSLHPRLRVPMPRPLASIKQEDHIRIRRTPPGGGDTRPVEPPAGLEGCPAVSTKDDLRLPGPMAMPAHQCAVWSATLAPRRFETLEVRQAWFRSVDFCRHFRRRRSGATKPARVGVSDTRLFLSQTRAKPELSSAASCSAVALAGARVPRTGVTPSPDDLRW